MDEKDILIQAEKAYQAYLDSYVHVPMTDKRERMKMLFVLGFQKGFQIATEERKEPTPC